MDATETKRDLPLYICQIEDELFDIANEEAKILESIDKEVGYSDWAEKEFEKGYGFAKIKDHKIRIFMMHPAEDKEDAEDIAKRMENRVSKYLGQEVKFATQRNIYGVCENAWYVTCDTTVTLEVDKIIQHLKNIANRHAKIQEGPFNAIGYASYAETEYELGFATENEDGIHLMMEWQAEDNKDAEAKSRELTEEISSLFNSKITFKAEQNIWGNCVDAWFVTIDKTIELDIGIIKNTIAQIEAGTEEEPPFNVGDWFRLKKDGSLFQANSNDVEFPESTLAQAEIWQPKEGEWVIPMFQRGNNFAVIKWEQRYEGTSYEFCEPFIGNLPSSIQEQERNQGN